MNSTTKIGVDANLISSREAVALASKLRDVQGELVAVTDNPVDAIWSSSS